MKKFLIFLILTISFVKLAVANNFDKISSANNGTTFRQGLPDQIITSKEPPFQYDSGRFFNLHVNGINTNEDDAWKNAQALEEVAEIDSNFVVWNYVYNPSGDKAGSGFWTSLFDALTQKVRESRVVMSLEDFTDYWIKTNKLNIKKGTPEYAQLMQQVAHLYQEQLENASGANFERVVNEFNSKVPPVEFKSILDLVAGTNTTYANYESSPHRVLLIPHSQGNLYANALYRLLTDRLGFSPNNLSIYGIASPAKVNLGDRIATIFNYIKGQAEMLFGGFASYLTSNNDYVINSARLLFNSLTTGPILPANIDIKFSLSNLLGHNLVDTYLADENSVKQIKKMINLHVYQYGLEVSGQCENGRLVNNTCIHYKYGTNGEISISSDFSSNIWSVAMLLSSNPSYQWAIKGGPNNMTICTNSGCELYLRQLIEFNGNKEFLEMQELNFDFSNNISIVPHSDKLSAGKYKVLVAQNTILDVTPLGISNIIPSTVEYEWIDAECPTESADLNNCNLNNQINMNKCTAGNQSACAKVSSCNHYEYRLKECEAKNKRDDYSLWALKRGVYGKNLRYVIAAKHEWRGQVRSASEPREDRPQWTFRHVLNNDRTSNCPYFDKDCQHLRGYLSRNTQTYYEDGMFVAATFEYNGDKNTAKPYNLADDVVETRNAQ